MVLIYGKRIGFGIDFYFWNFDVMCVDVGVVVELS